MMPDQCAYCDEPAPFTITESETDEKYSVCGSCLEILSGVKD
jgi:hypothetical protein